MIFLLFTAPPASGKSMRGLPPLLRRDAEPGTPPRRPGEHGDWTTALIEREGARGGRAAARATPSGHGGGTATPARQRRQCRDGGGGLVPPRARADKARAVGEEPIALRLLLSRLPRGGNGGKADSDKLAAMAAKEGRGREYETQAH